MTLYTAYTYENYMFSVEFLPGFTCDGEATLCHDAESGTWGEFYVHDFTTRYGEIYTRGGAGPMGSKLTADLFDLVSKAIERDADAIEFFSEQVDDYRAHLRIAAE